MRITFVKQYEIGLLKIEDTPLRTNSRDDFPKIVASLLKIYTTKKYRDQILSILEAKIINTKRKTGRMGLNLWQIFVLGQVRLALNKDYDSLESMANENSVLRQLLGIESKYHTTKPIQLSYQRIVDNVRLLDEETLKLINNEIVKIGYDVFKKGEAEALDLKTDSFVVESNVHFPTDFGLLYDSARKTVMSINKYIKINEIPKGWRKSQDWLKTLKNLCRALGIASKSKGKKKDQNVKDATKIYLNKANALLKKNEKWLEVLENIKEEQTQLKKDIIYFNDMLSKHIDLLERRVINDETIPHDEKIFSIFETYTEWICKGKINNKVELGKMVSITTDQFGLIVSHYIHEYQSDSKVVVPIAEEIIKRFKVNSWSFDKGYWSRSNKAYLLDLVEILVMPKKGKPNKKEFAEENQKEFKKFRNAHSAVESNINELEHCGLDRCPDRGFPSFKRYVSLGITAYNLSKIGTELIRQKRKEAKKTFRLAA